MKMMVIFMIRTRAFSAMQHLGNGKPPEPISSLVLKLSRPSRGPSLLDFLFPVQFFCIVSCMSSGSCFLSLMWEFAGSCMMVQTHLIWKSRKVVTQAQV